MKCGHAKILAGGAGHACARCGLRMLVEPYPPRAAFLGRITIIAVLCAVLSFGLAALLAARGQIPHVTKEGSERMDIEKPVERICGNCDHGRTNPANLNQISCRCLPPVTLLMQQKPGIRPGTVQQQTSWLWPLVGRQDSCGQFKDRGDLHSQVAVTASDPVPHV